MGNEAPKEGVVDRRTVIAAVGIGAGVAATGVIGSKITGSDGDTSPRHLPPPQDDAVAALFGELNEGARVGRWTVVRVYGVHLGAIPVILQPDDGEAFQVDVLRRDADGPAGVGNTPSLSLYLANRGDGSSPTTEEHGLGAMTLAHALAERERAGADVPSLMTLRERLASYPDGIYSVPV